MRSSVYLHRLDLKIKDFTQPWETQPSSKGLGPAAVFMRQVGWSLAHCGCVWSKSACDNIYFSPFSLPVHRVTTWRSKATPADLPTFRTALLQCHRPCSEGRFPSSPQDREVPGTHLCLSSLLYSQHQLFTCRKFRAHPKFTEDLAGTYIPQTLKYLQEHPAL